MTTFQEWICLFFSKKRSTSNKSYTLSHIMPSSVFKHYGFECSSGINSKHVWFLHSYIYNQFSVYKCIGNCQHEIKCKCPGGLRNPVAKLHAMFRSHHSFKNSGHLDRITTFFFNVHSTTTFLSSSNKKYSKYLRKHPSLLKQL